MLEKDNWIALAQFIKQNNNPAFTASMRPIALVEHSGPRGGTPKKRIVEGRFLDQAFALTGILPLHLHVWNGRESEIAEWLKRERPFGGTVIREYHPRSDDVFGKEFTPGKRGEKREVDPGVKMRQDAFALINAIASGEM